MPKVANLANKGSFCDGLKPVYRSRLDELGREVRFERDQIIFREGDESPFFYVILSGRVSLEVTALGRALRVATLEDGDELGWSSLLPHRGKQFQARALEGVRAMALDGARLREACEHDPAFGYEVMKRLLGVVSERLEALRMQLFDMYAPTGGGR